MATNKQEAVKLSSQLISEAVAKIREAEQLADDWQFTLRWDLSYGMGGQYIPKPPEGWKDSSSAVEYEFDYVDSNLQGDWMASSDQC